MIMKTKRLFIVLLAAVLAFCAIPLTSSATAEVPDTYGYTVNYVYYLDGVITNAVSKDIYYGSAYVGPLTLADNGRMTDSNGNTYTLGDASELNVNIPVGDNIFTLNYYATTKDIPPQVVTPTPAPTEEIITPTATPEQEEIIDEETPTDVPQTGDESTALPALALVLLAGAALVLTLKKDKKHN